MSYPLSMDLQQKPIQTLKQLQRMIMSRQMQQAINMLQMPVMELSPAVELEMEQNPVLEYIEEGDDQTDIETEQLRDEVEEEATEIEDTPEIALKFDERDFEVLRRLDEDMRDQFSESELVNAKSSSQQDKLHTFLESSIVDRVSLFEHLMRQATESFSEQKEMKIAEALIGNFDECGFLQTPLLEIATIQACSVEEVATVLKVIQTFHPIGVGAKDLQESMLIQLRVQGNQETLAYVIVENYFDDLLHNRIPTIKKGLHCSTQQIGEMIDLIAKLDMHPGAQLSTAPINFIVPDISICQENEHLKVVVNDESIPRLRLNRRYLRMLDDESLSTETKEFIKQKVVSAKWLMRNIMQRNDTLTRIAESIVKSQEEFLKQPDGKMVPMTMKIVADELELHESTIARAVSNKYIDTPRGVLPLRSFFTSALSTNEGEEISARTAREMIKELIKNEDHSSPLSDEALSALLKEKGIKCARRTVAKYRNALKLGNAQQRRKF